MQGLHSIPQIKRIRYSENARRRLVGLLISDDTSKRISWPYSLESLIFAGVAETSVMRTTARQLLLRLHVPKTLKKLDLGYGIAELAAVHLIFSMRDLDEVVVPVNCTFALDVLASHCPSLQVRILV